MKGFAICEHSKSDIDQKNSPYQLEGRHLNAKKPTIYFPNKKDTVNKATEAQQILKIIELCSALVFFAVREI